jgi:hypothetical protein
MIKKVMMTIDDIVYDEPECAVVHETEEAILVHRSGPDDKVWVPKSVIHDNSEIYEEGCTGTLVVFMWFADKQGWI